jgi:hypothetical protein
VERKREAILLFSPTAAAVHYKKTVTTPDPLMVSEI